MAGKTGAPEIAYRHHVARAEHQLGVLAGGVFVPFAILSDARYAQLEENAKNEAEASETTEEVSE